MPKKEEKGYVNFKPTTAALREDQRDGLKELAARKRVPQQQLIREAIDDLLQKHKQRKS